MMVQPVSLLGASVLTPGGALSVADVHLADGRIVDKKAAESRFLDCRGYHVFPGIVDVHGDAFEVELHPRPGVEMDFSIAMRSVDRQLVANGITTAFHGLSVSWEPGARSRAAARRFMAELDGLRAGLMADHRVQLRWEISAFEAVGDIEGWLAQVPVPAIAFNDHLTETLETMRAGDEWTLDKWAQRAGVTLAQYLAAAEAAQDRLPEVPQMVRKVAGLAQKHGAVMLAHDESTPDERRHNRALGMQVSEFPLSRAVAADAVANGEHVVMGGPNLLRGNSHKGHMSARDAVGDGTCTILASDYYYPSLFHAAERLVRERGLSMADAWGLVSQNPAAAMGLKDRGSIAPGKRADLVVVNCSGDWRLVHTIVGGAVVSFGV